MRLSTTVHTFANQGECGTRCPRTPPLLPLSIPQSTDLSRSRHSHLGNSNRTRVAAGWPPLQARHSHQGR